MALRLSSVTRRYGGHLALDSVSLHVRPGDCYGFLGHNGAGKTTSMRVALGLEVPDRGQVVVDGFDAARFPREARARMGGLIETPGFHGHLDGVANLATLARLQGFDRAGSKREAARLVEAVGLSAAGTKPVRAYSQGMRQRLGIAQALVGSPKIVLLDEPMSGLDPEGIEEIRRLLLRLTRDEGRTVLLSSHQLSEISGLCNRIGILRQGRMLVEEETSKLLASDAGRYALATADDAGAAQLLAAEGIVARANPAGGLDVALNDRRPGDVAKALVSRGVELRTWAPRPPSLEEIYLRFAQADPGSIAAAEVHASEDLGPPAKRLAPRGPVRGVFGYELRRHLSTAAVPVLCALPALAALASVWNQHAKHAADLAAVEAHTLATATQVTGFMAVGESLQWAMPLLALVTVGLASQSIAGETSRGTLRNLLLRPVTRTGVVLGKAIGVFFAAFVAFALAKFASCAAADAWFGFGDVAEILPNGQKYVMPGGSASAIDPEMRRTFFLLIPVIAAFTGVGLLAGSLARGGAAGLALALGGGAALVLFGVADTSIVGGFIETAGAVSNVREPDRTWQIAAPLVCAAVTLAAAAWVLRRRSIR